MRRPQLDGDEFRQHRRMRERGGSELRVELLERGAGACQLVIWRVVKRTIAAG